jgi:hypothetical protein
LILFCYQDAKWFGMADVKEELVEAAADLLQGQHTVTEPAQFIICPHCGQRINFDDALRHDLAADVIARREAELRKKAEDEAAEKVRVTLDDQEKRLAELTGQLKQQRAAERQLRQQQRELEDQKEAWDLERERMRDDIRKEERERAASAQQERYEDLARRKEEDHKTEVRQLKDKLERMSAQLEEAARRGATRARQEEGIARQDVFAAELRGRFPDDEITVAARGQAGADITQRIRYGHRDCGTILWECKRAVNWSGAWVGKLADDARKAGAGFGVIVSETLPPGMEGSGRVDEIWICDFGSAVHLAAGLRWVLIAASQYEAANAARADISGKVYDYIATGGFASRCEAINRAIETMTSTLGKERRYYEQRWKEWERHIETVAGSLYGIAGDLVRLGAEVPPPLHAELPEATLSALPSVPAS